MVFLYDIIIILFFISYLPVFFVKLKQADDKKRLLLDRFGFYSQEFKAAVKDKKVIWLHAVSVGEVMAVRSFVSELRLRFSDYTLVVSTVTPTGNKVARETLGNEAHIIYFPLDISLITRKVVSVINPRLIILMETELWPNLILSADKHGTKVAVVNGRISPKSFRSYYKISSLIKGVLNKVDLFLMQNRQYAKRLEYIGVPKDKIEISGNMKFDNVVVTEVSAELLIQRRQEFGFASDDLILIAASTHRGEESVMLDLCSEMQEINPRFKVLIVPRHIERADEIAALCAERDLAFNVADSAGVSEKIRNIISANNFKVFILNTIGQLKNTYAFADFVFMGGSLIRHGGQNPLEALVFSKPIITGAYTFNFSVIYRQLEEHNALVRVSGKNDLKERVIFLIKNQKASQEMTKRAVEWFKSQKGAGRQNCDYLIKLLAEL